MAGRAAIFAALVLFGTGAALAQDVTLISREGNIVLNGTLQGFDGEFYRLDTAYGPLTVDAQGVICDGPACPDLIAPKATIRLVGAPDAGARLLPGLLRAFAEGRGLIYAPTEAATGWAATILDPATGKVLADLSFQPLSPDEAAAAVTEGRAELKVSAMSDSDFGARPLALDALVPIVAPDNPTPEVSTVDLVRALTGEATNWADLGGPDMPLVLHALDPATDVQRALSERLGQPLAKATTHPDLASLAAAVAHDPWALAITGRSEIGAAKSLALADSCGFPLLPSSIAVKAEDYPLALPLFLLTPPRRLPLLAREFLEFLATPAAEAAVAEAGYIDRSVERAPMTQDGLRLLNAIQGAGEDVTLADLKRLAEVMDGADRLSLTFRFQEGTSMLDATSQENLLQLARLIAADRFPAQALILAGFSDGQGEAAANRALSLERAQRVAADLAAIAPDLRPDEVPRVEGFGEALPMACDETAVGRRLNRRVELWVVPDFAPPPPAAAKPAAP
ncbi:phosphate ABC transporter substrate-binding/OmpA family protein [Rhodobacter sp. Har01]|uniref:phosphate ABC transporter substrate-binding/OmpA family protein n=1 Tax=Rhodobacter sp. Har01 TaxID=2883999 RepID=UPI001D06B623|nr:phosphate ABC transporter substrate-binding/OmpA family protein [Rhodobacter sp. Har01]MCB6178052.1 phosphate ABC transporter substrate-binding/OmpA family protein [Rhodobacter sp. Har01]